MRDDEETTPALACEARGASAPRLVHRARQRSSITTEGWYEGEGDGRDDRDRRSDAKHAAVDRQCVAVQHFPRGMGGENADDPDRDDHAERTAAGDEQRALCQKLLREPRE